ncbi:MAG: hypothetical protein QOE70_3253 [Chthoniobacter sp.]|jgi:anti-anti-sigma factor|nr:hypothetical protein [Chthoniobacter sp.]
MQIQEEKIGDVLVLTISEHLDSSTCNAFENRLLGTIDRGEKKILVNCGPLEYVNSAGLKVFLIAAKQIETVGAKLVLCALSPSVLMIFEMIGFNRIMKIVPTHEEGLRALNGEVATA